MLANYSVTYSAIDTQGINYFHTKILHLAFLHCAGPETDHVTISSSTPKTASITSVNLEVAVPARETLRVRIESILMLIAVRSM